MSTIEASAIEGVEDVEIEDVTEEEYQQHLASLGLRDLNAEDLTEEERAAWIAHKMEVWGVSEQEARFSIAMARGETQGDCVEFQSEEEYQQHLARLESEEEEESEER